MNIIQSPSNNFSNSSYEKIGVQIHKTLGLMPETVNWLRDPRSLRSYHVVFARNGDIHQLVPLNKRAWSSGRINQPNNRAQNIMMRTQWRTWVKPGHYLVQCGYECLNGQEVTEEQYKSSIWYYRTLPFQLTERNFLTHKDTAIDKPNLDYERNQILQRLDTDVSDCKELIIDNWHQLRIKVENNKIHLTKVL